nr:hypothetical protein Iba_chr03dCG7790 [Ipomoea batatas]
MKNSIPHATGSTNLVPSHPTRDSTAAIHPTTPHHTTITIQNNHQLHFPFCYATKQNVPHIPPFPPPFFHFISSLHLHFHTHYTILISLAHTHQSITPVHYT